MTKKTGLFFMAVGAVLIGLSLYFSYTLSREEKQIEQTSVTVLSEMALQIEQAQDDGYVIDPYLKKMQSLMIDGYEYVGCLAIPDLELELPIMSELDKARLKLAPCLYQGTIYTEDMVIGAHNYKRHFGNLSQLIPGASVVFTTMDGSVRFYEVTAIETLLPQELDKLLESDYDLTLFTCTYGGSKRVVVRCDSVSS